MQFVDAFSDELTKLAAYDNPVDGATSAVEGTQGRHKQLPGKLPTPQERPVRSSTPTPETTPPAMLRP